MRSSPLRRDDGRRRPPQIEQSSSAPEWAGERGERLIRLTREQAAAGVDDPLFKDDDPLAELTRWFGAGNRLTKRALEPSMNDYDDRRVRVFRPSWGSRRLRIDLAAAQVSDTTISFTLDGARAHTGSLDAFDHELLRQVRPMRDFARRLKQTESA